MPCDIYTCWLSGEETYFICTNCPTTPPTEACEERHRNTVAEDQVEHPKTGDCP